MNPKSAIQKGRRLENFICEEIEKTGLGKATRTPGSGSGLKKSDIFANIPFLIEAKNQKKIKILDWIDQAKKEAEQGNYDLNKWAVIFNDFRKGEFQSVYVVLDLWEWLELLKRNKDPLVKNPDKEISWKIKSAINSLKSLLKSLE